MGKAKERKETVGGRQKKREGEGEGEGEERERGVCQRVKERWGSILFEHIRPDMCQGVTEGWIF